MNSIELFVSCIIIWIMNYILGKQLFEYEKKISFFKLLFCIIVFSFLLSIVNEMYFELLHGIVKIVLSYILIFLFYQILFKAEISQSLVTTLILYLIVFVSEIILVVIISPITYIFDFESIAFLKHTITINILNASLSTIIVRITRTKLMNLVTNSKVNTLGSICIILLLLITISLLFFRIPVSEWRFNSDLIITMIIIFCSCMIGLFLLKQKADIHQTTSMYQQLVEYSDITNNLLEDYRVVSHEHKNQLSIIRSMIDNNNKELVDYIDNLLEKREIIKYQWIGELNHLPLSGLKGLINYKLIEMESNNVNTSISISKEISKTKLNKLSTKQKDNLYSIMGVYLDNAIQASRESKEKEISLEIYKEKKDIVIVLANTYSGNIELGKVDTYGYSTKGKNHGVGLHLVKKIIDIDNTFSQNRSIFENYYVQELRIHLNEIKKPKK